MVFDPNILNDNIYPMPKPKYINTKEVVRLTGVTASEVYALVHSGALPAHKAPRSGWRLNVDAVEAYFGITLDEKLQHVVREDSRSGGVISDSPVVSAHAFGTRVIADKEHYDEVIARVLGAKSSILIATANFRKFRLKTSSSSKYSDGTPFVEALVMLAAKGVRVDLVCSMPSEGLLDDWFSRLRQYGYPESFRARFCERNHSKLVIIDGVVAYIGSANVTGAGLGQGTYTDGNFETGILTDDPALVRQALERFRWIQSTDRCRGCHRSDDCRAEFVEDSISEMCKAVKP